MKKKCQVVMLPTEKAIDISPIMQEDDKLYSVREFGNKHLYITSGDEIKEGDYHYAEGEIQLTTKETIKYLNSSGDDSFKKVIATTNNSLKTNYWNGAFDKQMQYSLPQPSPQFIAKYIEEYNKGNKIEWVDVEYEYLLGHEEDENQNLIPELFLKVDKNNYITITKVKDSWNRVDVEDLIIQAVAESHDWSRENNDVHSIQIIQRRFLNKWIEENL